MLGERRFGGLGEKATELLSEYFGRKAQPARPAVAGLLKRATMSPAYTGPRVTQLFLEVHAADWHELTPDDKRDLEAALKRLATVFDLEGSRILSCPPEFFLSRGQQDNEIGLNNSFFTTESTVEYDDLRFRSPAEIAIYRGFKHRDGILYFPNAAAVLGGSGQKKEPDFLVCQAGKWGILEVMGDKCHARSAVKDHERARLFKAHGIRCIEFFSASRCEMAPESVVDEFLALLAAS